MPDTDSLLALAAALARANAAASAWARKGPPVAGRTAEAMSGLVAALAAVAPSRRGRSGNRRGPKVKHDRDFAIDSLIDIVGTDPDGLAAGTTALIRKLARRFRDADKDTPGVTWLKSIVAEFQKRSLIRDREAFVKWHVSEDLRAVFESPGEFASFCRTRDRIEEKWFRDKHLQKRFGTVASYIASLFSPEVIAATELTNCQTNGGELATISDQLSW